MAVRIDKTAWRGWNNCWRIANAEVELVVTADIGPRIISFGFTGGQNVFKNYDHQMGGIGEPSWMIRGGSRVWLAPEDPVASYAPDNDPVDIEVRGDTLIATAPVEQGPRVRKQIEIRLAPDGTAVEVIHRISNVGQLPVEFAAWVLSVMAPGGVAVTGLPPRGTHPENLAPSNPLVVWPFTDLSDPRWRFLRKYVVLRQDPEATTPQKLGHFNADTWAAYFLHGDIFVKRTAADPTLAYPDMGCSFETFTNRDMLELETLGPIRRVPPGEGIEHTEKWNLYRGAAPTNWTDSELDRVLAPLLING